MHQRVEEGLLIRRNLLRMRIIRARLGRCSSLVFIALYLTLAFVTDPGFVAAFADPGHNIHRNRGPLCPRTILEKLASARRPALVNDLSPLTMFPQGRRGLARRPKPS